MAVIRVRGEVKVSRKVKDALRSLNLDRVNHLVLLPKNDVFRGQLAKAKDLITFGEINAETLARLLLKRGRLKGDKKIDSAFLSKNNFASAQALAQALIEGKTSLGKLGIKKVFRLHPPRKGFGREGVKTAFTAGGALGERKEGINSLIERMA